MQVYVAPVGLHKAPFLQVEFEHAFICKLHNGPVNPGLHMHVNEYWLICLEQ
jgi:hypothetical protein